MNAKTSEASAMSRSDYSFLQQIVIQQIYGNGTASTIFTFVNPRIEQFDFDGLDHEDSSPNLVTCSFIYDYIVVETPSKGAIIYNAQELVGAKTDLFSGGAVASREGIKTASLASLMDTVNTANGGVAANKTKSGSVYDVLKGSQFDLKSISGISDVNIASTLGVEKIADGYLDNKLFNLTGKVSSRMKGMNPIASKILSPLANQSINALSKPLRGLTSMFDNTVTGSVNGVGQAASNSVTTGINSVISGTAGGVNSAVKSIGTGLNGITQSVAGSFNSATSSINKSISSGIGSTMDSIKSTFSSTTDSINNAISKPAESVASSVDSATSTIVKDLESGVEYDTSYVEPVKPVEGVDDII
jgi:phage-related protein